MEAQTKILITFGTRPEAIKMAPVVKDLVSRTRFAVRVVTTGQHRELLDQVIKLFRIPVHADLKVMKPDQTLSHVTSEVLHGIDREIHSFRPDWLLVHGDTTTSFAASLAAFYNRVKLAHVEAGLRTGDRFNPFPEEINRRFIDSAADLLFAPTQRAKEALLHENVDEARICVTGNTVIDALLDIRGGQPLGSRPAAVESGPFVLVTCHRRESFGEDQARLFRAIRELAEEFPTIHWLFPMHPNPNLRAGAEPILSGLENVRLVEPLDYREFVRAMSTCLFIVTDSGGIQEEAPTFGKPVLVLRRVSERMESVEAGFSILVGVDPELLKRSARPWLSEPASLKAFSSLKNPYGDGHAAQRIGDFLGAFSRNGSNDQQGPIGSGLLKF